MEVIQPGIPVEGSPWSGSAKVEFEPDFAHLESLLDSPFRQVTGSSSGSWTTAIDDWIAPELRRSGFPADEVWPRQSAPRVLPREIGLLLQKATPAQRADLEKLILRTPGVVASDARILGRAYVKQVDVVIAQWSRGPDTYDSTGLLLVDYADDPTESENVSLNEMGIPDDLRAGQFFDRLISRVLDVAPVDMHVPVRENREHTTLSIDENPGE